MNVRIHDTVLTAIAVHALREAPIECCGLLLGTNELIDEAVATRNILAHPSRYRVDPEQHIAVNRSLRGTPRSIIGVYHSHPRTAAVPSPRDIAQAYYPEFVWLIVSLAGPRPEFAAYRIVAERAEMIALTSA